MANGVPRRWGGLGHTKDRPDASAIDELEVGNVQDDLPRGVDSRLGELAEVIGRGHVELPADCETVASDLDLDRQAPTRVDCRALGVRLE